MRAFLLIATSLAALSLAPTYARAEARNPYAIAVIIGNKTYQNHDIPEVKYADRDAEAIKRYAIDVLGYDENNIIYVENATQGNFNAIFGTANVPQGKLARWLRPDNESDVLVYYSGHGVPGIGDGEQYLLPVDADPNTVNQNGYPVQTLYDNLQSLGAHSVTVLLDACFSGASAGGALFTGKVVTRPISAARPGGLTVLTAAQSDQIANWDDRHKHGLFTEYFLEAVYGRADDEKYGGHHDGKITLAAVQKYLDKEMSYVARRENPRVQNATVSGDPGFVLASLTPDAPPVRHDEGASVSVPQPVPPPAPRAAPAPIPPAPFAQADDLERQGEAALARKDYLAALELFRKAADKGNASAMTEVGFLYSHAYGVPQDYAVAMRWYRQAADQGNARAKNNIGWLYENGHGVPQDYAEAMRWYRQAAALGSDLGMNNIGRLYGEGHGVAQDYVEALRWYRQAAENGNADAMANLGVMYKLGLGVARDLVEARHWLSKAANLGDQTARDELAKLGAPPSSEITDKLSAEQRGAVGDKVRECWTKDPGALDLERMQVMLTVTTDETGVVRKAEVADQDKSRLADPRFWEFARRAVDAVMDARCAALPLPWDKLGKINELTFRFRP